MPEIVTKYPEMVYKILESVNINCGVGAPQKILKQCPKNNFCSFPGGEFCVYSIKEIPQMTQVSALDIFKIPPVIISLSALLIMVFLLGVKLGLRYQRMGKIKTI